MILTDNKPVNKTVLTSQKKFLKKFNVRIDAVGPWAIQTVWEFDTTSDGHEVDVEVMVHQVELLGRGERTRSAVDFAGEVNVIGIVCVFPHLNDV